MKTTSNTPLLCAVILTLSFRYSIYIWQSTACIKSYSSNVQPPSHHYFTTIETDSSRPNNSSDINEHPYVEEHDRINTSPRSGPYVIEEYKLLFFAFPKVASSQWVKLLARMSGNENWCRQNIHPQERNKVKHLFNYTTEEATEMMTSPEWTRAAFVREPKVRVLSAFLDQVMKPSDEYIRNHCSDEFAGDVERCLKYYQNFDIILQQYVAFSKDGFSNVHYEPLYDKIDEKWWPYINFIGYMDNLGADAKRLLRSIKSTKDGRNAWDRWGKTGWKRSGGTLRNDACHQHDSLQGSFLQANDRRHASNSSSKLLQYYTPELESYVEKHWAKDLDNPYYTFSPLSLFRH